MVIGFLFIYDRGDECGWFGPDKAVRHLKSVVDLLKPESIKKEPGLKDIPVIITSNLGQPEEVERGLQAGAVDYIVKANTAPAEIVEKVKSVLKK